ncbi:UNVERIFIED_CONTAM: hypothetical protein Slati_3068300, partial [Sesamum latifolium]
VTYPNNLIQQEERVGNIKGVATCRDGPRVSHLLFADDTLIFCHATKKARVCIKNVFRILEEASGLKMNMSKSDIVFSRNTPQHVRVEVAAVLGVLMMDKHDKYLELPALVGKSKQAVFDSIKERIWRKLKRLQVDRPEK